MSSPIYTFDSEDGHPVVYVLSGKNSTDPVPAIYGWFENYEEAGREIRKFYGSQAIQVDEENFKKEQERRRAR